MIVEARWFYPVYAPCVISGCLFVGFWPNLVSLNVGVQVTNALMLPLVLGFLIALACRPLPPSRRLRGGYFSVILAVTVVTCTLGVFGGFQGVGLLGKMQGYRARTRRSYQPSTRRSYFSSCCWIAVPGTRGNGTW
ncbi:MAG: hypothetical protein JO122_11310 [Acetobacteraceae bacterium]|nr:hypothetical protein [Acetobacteraceae bacterium]